MSKDIRKGTRFRHIDERGKVMPVERDNARNLYIKGTNTILKPGQYTDVSNIKPASEGNGHIIQKDRSQSYNDWWQENNLNGGFAYNGVTDDF